MKSLGNGPFPLTLRRLPLPSAGHGSLSLQRAVPLKGGMETIFLETNNRTEKREFTFEPVRGRLTYAAHLP